MSLQLCERPLWQPVDARSFRALQDCHPPVVFENIGWIFCTASCFDDGRGHGGLVVRLLVSHQRRTGFASQVGTLPESHKWESCRTMPLIGGFSRGVSQMNPPNFRVSTPYSPRFTLIGSQDLDVKSCPNIFNPSIKKHKSLLDRDLSETNQIGFFLVAITPRPPVTGITHFEITGLIGSCVLPLTAILLAHVTSGTPTARNDVPYWLVVGQFNFKRSLRDEIYMTFCPVSIRMAHSGPGYGKSRIIRDSWQPYLLGVSDELRSNDRQRPERFAYSFRYKLEFKTRVLITLQPLVHTVFDTFLEKAGLIVAFHCDSRQPMRKSPYIRHAAPSARVVLSECDLRQRSKRLWYCSQPAGLRCPANKVGESPSSAHFHRSYLYVVTTNTRHLERFLPYPRSLSIVGFIPLPGHSGFLHVGIVPDDAVGRRVFSGTSRFPPPFHSGAAPYSTQSPHFGSQDLDARLHNPLYSRASDVCSLAAAPVLPHTCQHGISFLVPCKSAIGSESSRACTINSDPIAKPFSPRIVGKKKKKEEEEEEECVATWSMIASPVGHCRHNSEHSLSGGWSASLPSSLTQLNSKTLYTYLSSAIGLELLWDVPSTLTASSYGSTVEQPIFSGDNRQINGSVQLAVGNENTTCHNAGIGHHCNLELGSSGVPAELSTGLPAITVVGALQVVLPLSFTWAGGVNPVRRPHLIATINKQGWENFAGPVSSRLDFTILCTVEHQMFVHWLLPQCYHTPVSMGFASCSLASLLLAQSRLGRKLEVAANGLYIPRGRAKQENQLYVATGNKQDKIDFKRVYTEVTIAIGSQFIRHALDDSVPITDLQGSKKRILYCQMWGDTEATANEQTSESCLTWADGIELPECRVLTIGSESCRACRMSGGPMTDAKLTYTCVQSLMIVSNYSSLIMSVLARLVVCGGLRIHRRHLGLRHSGHIVTIHQHSYDVTTPMT
ncbi:hypothetical protein PR048_030714 [Dryococelus australis]|uniref:Uncharacterized protein n=1 Tax=Dryococelus australis TaxID=614101 RepID=A0ABQ9GDJ5_9NEOP|nr:hypothetical protein PR048_030714 [Dryococelus australis]